MTIADLAPVIDYLEDGVTMAYPVPFRFLAPTDIHVTRIVDELVTALVIDVDYHVAGGATDAGGTMTLITTVGGGQLRIERETPLAQTADYQTNDSFPAETHEGVLDKLMAIAQEQDAGLTDITGRALKVPVPETIGPIPPASERAQGILGFDADGEPIILPSEELGSVAVVAQRREVVAVAGQTIFQTNATYTVGYVSVYVNGVRLSEQEFTALDGTNVVLDEPCIAGDIVVLEGFLGSAVATDAANMTFIQAGTGAVSRSAQAKMRETVSLKDYGAVGDNVTNDTAAVTAAINYVQSFPYGFTPAIYVPPGLYTVAALPTLTKPVRFFGDNARSSALMLSQTINIVGQSQRAAGVSFHDMTIAGFAMSAGYLVNIDWAQDIVFEDVIFSNPWNGVMIRQAGGIHFHRCLFDPVRGAVGVDIAAYNGTRNGELDTTDLIVFDCTTIQSNLPAVGGSSNAIMLRLDGRCHTIQCDGLRLLAGGIGLQTLNTAGLPSFVVPRFIVGSSIEVENMYRRCLDLQACREFNPDYLFAANSHIDDAVYLGPGCDGFAPSKLAVSSAWFSGVNIDGATNTRLLNPLIYNNALVGAGAKPAVYVKGSGTVSIDGGLIGKNTTLPAYTEQQTGVLLDAAYNGVLIMRGVDLRGNQTFALGDTGLTATGSNVSACPGYTPRGIALQTVGASPYVYTAGLTVENVNLYNGSGVVATIGGVVATTTVPAAFTLQPRQSVSIAYATIPTMAISKA